MNSEIQINKDLESLKAIFVQCSEAWRHEISNGVSFRFPKGISIYGKDIRRVEYLGFTLDWIDIQKNSTVAIFKMKKNKNPFTENFEQFFKKTVKEAMEEIK